MDAQKAKFQDTVSLLETYKERIKTMVEKDELQKKEKEEVFALETEVRNLSQEHCLSLHGEVACSPALQEDSNAELKHKNLELNREHVLDVKAPESDAHADNSVVLPTLMALVSPTPEASPPPRVDTSRDRDGSCLTSAMAWPPKSISEEVAARVAKVLMGKYRNLPSDESIEREMVVEEEKETVVTETAEEAAAPILSVAPILNQKRLEQGEVHSRLARLLAIGSESGGNEIESGDKMLVKIQKADPKWCAEIDTLCEKSSSKAANQAAQIVGTQEWIEEEKLIEEVNPGLGSYHSCLGNFYDAALLELVEDLEENREDEIVHKTALRHLSSSKSTKQVFHRPAKASQIGVTKSLLGQHAFFEEEDYESLIGILEQV